MRNTPAASAAASIVCAFAVRVLLRLLYNICTEIVLNQITLYRRNKFSVVLQLSIMMSEMLAR